MLSSDFLFPRFLVVPPPILAIFTLQMFFQSDSLSFSVHKYNFTYHDMDKWNVKRHAVQKLKREDRTNNNSAIILLLDMLKFITAILSYFNDIQPVHNYSIPVRGRELELNSVKKSNTSGSGKALHSAQFFSYAYLLFGHNVKMAELSR